MRGGREKLGAAGRGPVDEDLQAQPSHPFSIICLPWATAVCAWMPNLPLI